MTLAGALAQWIMTEAGDSPEASALSAPAITLIIMLITGAARAAAAAHIHASAGTGGRGAPWNTRMIVKEGVTEAAGLKGPEGDKIRRA